MAPQEREHGVSRPKSVSEKQVCENHESQRALFKNPRDASQFANLARQMYPKQWQFAVEAYKDATR